MTDQMQNLVLEQLRLIRGEQAATREDMREIRFRLTMVETGLGRLTADVGHLAASSAQLHLSLDRLTERVERVERRLELTG
jgi:archaellum component FlaC